MVTCNGHHYVVADSSHILLTCEHASQQIPAQFHNLGLSQEERLHAKDLYDPGSRDMTAYLSESLHASALYADVSRLVIDYNRRLDAQNKHANTYHSCPLKTELIVEKNGREELIAIPQNIFADATAFATEEKKRYETYVVPYVESAYTILDQLRTKHQKLYIVQVHSFFPTYNGVERDVDIAVLYDDAEDVGHRVTCDLQGRTNLVVAENRPWSMKDTDGVVFEKIYDMDDVDIIAFDVNNKHLKTQSGVKKIAQLLTESLRAQL